MAWLIACLGATAIVHTQSPAFEVASIKPNRSQDVLYSSAFQPGGRFIATNIPVRELIRLAYTLQSHQLEGGPDWIGSERFDVIAQGTGDQARLRMSLRTLLQERFQLAAHQEHRLLAIYALRLARDDRRLGPRLRVSSVDCTAVMVAAHARGERVGLPRPGERQACDLFTGLPPRMAADGVSMAQLATSLSRFVGRTVSDRTELPGIFDFDLEWTPELPQRPAGAPDVPVRFNGVEVDPTGPSLFTALREQLGLELEAERGPVEVLVIDSIERPTPD
jgi:uncharacterized protein (TIGR03435 family)